VLAHCVQIALDVSAHSLSNGNARPTARPQRQLEAMTAACMQMNSLEIRVEQARIGRGVTPQCTRTIYVFALSA
jgi:hypothetical protein